MDKELKQKVFSGTKWSTISAIGVMIINLLVSIFMSHYLFPEEYGLIAMISVFTAVAGSFVSFGFSLAIIREPNPTDDELSSIFYINLLMGLIITSIIFLSAPYIAAFYAEEKLVNLVRATAPLSFIGSTIIVQGALLNKKMLFKLDALISLGSVVFASMVGMYMAVAGFGVWSLVVMSFIGMTLRSILLWYMQEWRPRLYFKLALIKRYFNFSVNIFFTGILNTLFLNIYSLVIGKYFSASDVGLYNRANSYQNMPTKLISDVLKKVLYPAFSTMHDDLLLFKTTFSKAIRFASFLAFPIAVGIMVSADSLIKLILPIQWWDVVLYLQLLSIVGLLTPLHRLSTNIALVIGRSDMILYIDLFGKAVIVMGIVIGMKWGVLGLVIAYICFSLIDYVLKFYFFGRLIEYSLVDNFKDVMKPLISAILMGVSLFLIDQMIEVLWVELLVNVLVGVCLYSVFSYLMKVDELSTFKKVIYKFAGRKMSHA